MTAAKIDEALQQEYEKIFLKFRISETKVSGLTSKPLLMELGIENPVDAKLLANAAESWGSSLTSCAID